MSAHANAEKKGHVCPPSDATHPSGRWESLFVYSFINKFTNLKTKIEGLETPMDFEEALLSQEPNTILTQLLSRFILNLKPQTRNLSIDQISTTVATVLSDYLKSSERTIFLGRTTQTEQGSIRRSRRWFLHGGLGFQGRSFYATHTAAGAQAAFFRVIQLKILRQLVELQLCHTPEIKSTIDRAWGVSQNKHKKKDPASAAPEPTDPQSQGQLQLVPLGQDSRRKRYWAVDDSPRLYVSTNPWKMAVNFETISSTREEYLAVIDELKGSAPPELKKGEKRTKMEQSHLTLIQTLEGRIEAIDIELVVSCVWKKRERGLSSGKHNDKQLSPVLHRLKFEKHGHGDRPGNRITFILIHLMTRRQDDADEYTYQEAEAYDDEFDDDFLNFRDESEGPSSRRASSSTGRRRSTRTAVLNANGKREAQEDQWVQWRGERRSTRLGAPPETQLDSEPRNKRARTEESTMSTGSVDAASTTSHSAQSGLKLKSSGAAALKPNEVAMEQIAGKKRSKYWVYAVEPAVEPNSGTDTPAPLDPVPVNGDISIDDSNGHSSDAALNGHNSGHDSDMEMDSPSPEPGNGNINGRNFDHGGSPSPLDAT
ncbi:hypothetical protein MSAN_02145200 [Mycena sanguinolenta]|uniref:WHIM1 domain-containing protein n=1 Tax=Mycena sanguinolenta TaxID=230812 RepID=A0A8H6XF12_9AGAR|nr:hypothetical protein MSAN_02145200 [Mycena sanguinolenta]